MTSVTPVDRSRLLSGLRFGDRADADSGVFSPSLPPESTRRERGC